MDVGKLRATVDRPCSICCQFWFDDRVVDG